jgi:hypothetical protein
MEPQFQTSFIPKKSTDPGIRIINAKEPISLFSILTTVIVIATIVASGVLFAYQQILKSQISQAEKDIVAAKQAFQPDTIKQLITASSQIDFTERLLNSHILINQIFNLLQNLTVKKIAFTDFTYINKNGSPSVVMDGESQSYNALVEQYSIFNQSGLILNPEFSDFALSTDGNITFKLSANVDPSVILYQKVVQSGVSQ